MTNKEKVQALEAMLVGLRDVRGYLAEEEDDELVNLLNNAEYHIQDAIDALEAK